MKTPAEIRVVFLTMISKLPKYVEPARVTCDSATLRVYLDRALVAEFVHSARGWLPWESSAGHADGRARAAVYRAMRAATAVHP